MALERKTVIDKIEVNRDNTFSIRFACLIVDGNEELAKSWHRSGLAPGESIDAKFAAISTNLVAQGKAPIDTSTLPRLKSIISLVHTPEVIEDYQSKQEVTTLRLGK